MKKEVCEPHNIVLKGGKSQVRRSGLLECVLKDMEGCEYGVGAELWEIPQEASGCGCLWGAGLKTKVERFPFYHILSWTV